MISTKAINDTGLDPNKSLTRLFKEDNWSVKTGIGGIFNALALALVCINPLCFPLSICLMALVQGYVLKTLRQKIKDPDSGLPNWDNWFDLFVSGMSWIALMTMFFFILMFAFYICLIVGALMNASKTMNPNFMLWMAGTAISIKLLSAWFSLFTQTLMANFAQEESMASGFAYFKVLKRLSLNPRDFLSAWILGIGVQFLFFVAPIATVIGAFFLPTTIFVSQLLSASFMAQAWYSSSPANSQTV